jgi:hypothetical protein
MHFSAQVQQLCGREKINADSTLHANRSVITRNFTGTQHRAITPVGIQVGGLECDGANLNGRLRLTASQRPTYI